MSIGWRFTAEPAVLPVRSYTSCRDAGLDLGRSESREGVDFDSLGGRQLEPEAVVLRPLREQVSDLTSSLFNEYISWLGSQSSLSSMTRDGYLKSLKFVMRRMSAMPR
jgi:hypothetical protein